MATAVQPIRVFRENVTNLEAAITLVLADPQTKPVHRLRTSTRRIEALLHLLDLLPGLPKYAKPARKLAKLLRKLRRAAGAVRDLDVQQDLVEQRTGSATVQKEAKRLAKLLREQRKDEAAHLLNTLQKLHMKLPSRLESLLDALAPAESLTVAPDQLLSLTRNWYQHNTPPAGPEAASDPDLLHTIRKSAKLARYIAESAEQTAAAPNPRPAKKSSAKSPSSSRKLDRPSRLAAQFESLQEAGGIWHDLLTLSAFARHHLGKRSALTQEFEQECERALTQYRQHLLNQPA